MLKYHPDRQQETIALVMDELNRMSRLVNDLLLWLRQSERTFSTQSLKNWTG